MPPLDEIGFPPKTLDEIFRYHAPSPEQTVRYGALRDAARQFAQAIVELVPPSSDRTAALRHLRDAVMTANAGIALEQARGGGAENPINAARQKAEALEARLAPALAQIEKIESVLREAQKAAPSANELANRLTALEREVRGMLSDLGDPPKE